MSSQPTPTPTPGPKANTGRLLLIAVLLIAIAGGVYGYFYYANMTAPVDETAALKGFLKDQEKYAKLGEGYADGDGDLIADAPNDGKYQDAKELIFTEVAGDDLEKTAQNWEPFRKHLEAKTGLPVKFLKIDSPPREPNEDGSPATPPTGIDVLTQIDHMKTGKIHIAAFSTGQVQMAVNTGGFVPLYSPATAAGQYSYEMEVVVPADSPAKDVKDLKGKQVALVSLSSNSGWKASIVEFRDKFGLVVNKDFTYTNTGNHVISMYGVAVGRDAAPILANSKSTPEQKATALKSPGAKYDAACVAGDLLARTVGGGGIKADQFRTIHKAGPFPPLAFGIAHNLKPELAAKIMDAFETFSFEGNSVGERFQSQQRVKFAKIDYKKDWQVVRDVDAKLSDAILK